MARLDYSRFNGLGDSDSEEESTPAAQASDLLAELPSDLPKGLSLVLAARQGQQHLVDALLSSRVEVDSRDPHGGTALLRAVQLGIGARPTIQRLLEASAEVGALSDFGETPLSEAASSGSVELLQSLLDASRLVPPPSLLGAALAKAAEAKQRGTTRLLLEQKAPPLLEALFGWIDCADLEMMTALLERKASVNERREHDGETALVAASASRPEVVLLLCQWKAEVNAVNRKGVAPLVAACSASREAVVEALLNCRAAPDVPESSMSPLVAAALAGNCAVAQRLLAASATAEAVDAQGRTALAAAAATGSGQLCHLLLAARCDPNCAGGAAGAAGAPPLAIAVAAQHTALAVQLLAARADVEQLSERKQSPLMMAAAAGNLEMCRKLLEAGASPNAVDAEDAKSPLVLSASVGHREICQVLLEAKALVNSGSVTALHAAAANGHEEVCRDLLSARANLSALGPQQRTAAQAAQRAGYAALSELLSSP